MLKRCVFVAAGILLLAPGRASAQQPAGDALGSILCGGSVTIDFDCGGALNDVSVIVALLQNLSLQTTTFPIGSSSGGFTWSFDPTLGVQTRKSNSFGPMFAERPLTNGGRKLNVSLSYQHTQFDSVAGQPLNALRSSGPVDIVDSRGRVVEVGTLNLVTSLDLSIDRTTISASYGITDRVDVGVVLPFGRTRVSGNSVSRALDAGNREIASVASGNQQGSSSGIGDVIIRGKVGIPSPRFMSLAAGVDLRLPTGDENNLLGIGGRQAKFMVMAASNSSTVSPHVNVGYTKASEESIGPDEIDYVAGVDVAATPSVTIMGDIIGRRLRDVLTIGFINNGPSAYFSSDLGNVNLLLGTVGTKIKVGGMWLVSASVVFPLNNNGVKPGITPVIGLERAF